MRLRARFFPDHNCCFYPSYPTLYTQSKDYIVDETIEYIRQHNPRLSLNILKYAVSEEETLCFSQVIVVYLRPE